MDDPVKQSRGYQSAVRTARAASTRGRVLVAARELFVDQGYAATTVAQIARAAGVAVDTVYTVVGRKPDVLRLLVESAISGSDSPVPAQDRDYVARVRAAGTAREKIEAYADGIAALQPRLAPIFLALRDASATDPDCATVWKQITDRRASNMRTFADELVATGELRPGIDPGYVADVIWTMNAAEYYDLTVQRGWEAHQYRQHIADSWTRLFIAS